MAGTRLQNHKLFILLLALLLFFILNPLFATNHFANYIFGGLFSLLLFFGVYVLKHHRLLVVAAISLALFNFVTYWTTNIIFPTPSSTLLEYSLAAIYFILITIVVLTYVIENQVITFNTLCGAICGYLLIGLTWSFFFSIVFTLDHQAFDLPANMEKSFEFRAQQFIYFSFVTLSTLGFGDITPVSLAAKTLAWLEAITGQVYLTVWIAQLVGLHVAQKRRHSSQETQ